MILISEDKGMSFLKLSTFYSLYFIKFEVLASIFFFLILVS